MGRMIFLAGATAAVMVVTGAPARADDLSACLLKNTTAADRTTLIKWMFAAISLNPAVHSLSTMTQTDRDQASKEAAELVQRLMTADCRNETIYAIKYQGAQAVQAAFATLGKVAMAGLMSDPTVQAGLNVGKYFDQSKFDQLGKDAARLGK